MRDKSISMLPHDCWAFGPLICLLMRMFNRRCAGARDDGLFRCLSSNRGVEIASISCQRVVSGD